MEDWVDLPCFRQAELIDNWGKDFHDSEGSFSFGGELWVDHRSFEISGFKPDFVSKFEWGEGPSCPGCHDLAG